MTDEQIQKLRKKALEEIKVPKFIDRYEINDLIADFFDNLPLFEELVIHGRADAEDEVDFHFFVKEEEEILAEINYELYEQLDSLMLEIEEEILEKNIDLLLQNFSDDFLLDNSINDLIIGILKQESWLIDAVKDYFKRGHRIEPPKEEYIKKFLGDYYEKKKDSLIEDYPKQMLEILNELARDFIFPLSDKQAQAYAGREIMELTFENIGKLLNVARSVIYINYKRGKEKL